MVTGPVRPGARRVIGALVCLWLALPAVGCAEAEAGRPLRLVSLAPSVTESLFALGAGDRLAGVTAFCRFPPAAAGLPRVGGYYDTNIEAVLALQPDLVILLTESHSVRERFADLGQATLTLEMHSVAGVVSAWLMLGQATGRPAQAAELAEALRDRLAVLERRYAGRARRTVLLVMSREYGPGLPRDIYAAGRGEIFDELLSRVGAVNAYPRSWPKYPKLSAEGVLSLDPDVIVELVDDAAVRVRSAQALRQDWAAVPGLRAWEQGRIRVLVGSRWTIPGPGLADTADALAGAVWHTQR